MVPGDARQDWTRLQKSGLPQALKRERDRDNFMYECHYIREQNIKTGKFIWKKHKLNFHKTSVWNDKTEVIFKIKKKKNLEYLWLPNMLNFSSPPWFFLFFFFALVCNILVSSIIYNIIMWWCSVIVQDEEHFMSLSSVYQSLSTKIRQQGLLEIRQSRCIMKERHFLWHLCICLHFGKILQHSHCK